MRDNYYDSPIKVEQKQISPRKSSGKKSSKLRSTSVNQKNFCINLRYCDEAESCSQSVKQQEPSKPPYMIKQSKQDQIRVLLKKGTTVREILEVQANEEASEHKPPI